MKHEGWEATARALGITLAPLQRTRLDTYGDLLRQRAVPYGFVSAKDADRLEARHIADSLRAAPLVRATDGSAYDLGSGAGLPGIPVSIACPWLSMGLVESRRARAAFLELTAQELGLENVRVLHRRVEQLTEPVSVCFARAFVSATRSWAAAEGLLIPGGRLIYFAGEAFDVGELPSGLFTEVVPAPSALARSGPLVIMTRT